MISVSLEPCAFIAVPENECLSLDEIKNVPECKQPMKDGQFCRSTKYPLNCEFCADGKQLLSNGSWSVEGCNRNNEETTRFSVRKCVHGNLFEFSM